MPGQTLPSAIVLDATFPSKRHFCFLTIQLIFHSELFSLWPYHPQTWKVIPDKSKPVCAWLGTPGHTQPKPVVLEAFFPWLFYAKNLYLRKPKIVIVSFQKY